MQLLNFKKQFYLENSLENSFVKDGKLHVVALEKDIENRLYTGSFRFGF